MKTTFPIANADTLKFARWTPLLTALSLLVSSLIVQAAKPPPPPPSYAILYNRLGDGLQSDNGAADDGNFGTYIDTKTLGGVQARFDSYGRLTFSSGVPATSGRVAFFQVIDCLCDSLEPPAGEYQVNLYTTAADCDGPPVDLRTLSDGASAQVGMVIRILVPFLSTPSSKQQSEWFVVFGNWPAECAKYPCANGAKATVTRNGNTWTLEAPATDVCLVEAVRAQGGRVDMTQRSRIAFPFKLALTFP